MKILLIVGAVVLAVLKDVRPADGMSSFADLFYKNWLNAASEEVPTYTVHKEPVNTEDTKASMQVEETRTYHKDFGQKELADMFGVNHHDSVPKYYPAIVNGIQKLHRDEGHQITVKVFGDTLKINLLKNEKTVPDSHTTEFHRADGTVHKYTGVLGEFSTGDIEDDEHSHCAFHHNGGGISGLIRTHNDMLIIKPLPKRSIDEHANHIVYRMIDYPEGHVLHKYIKYVDPASDYAEKHLRRRRRSVGNQYPKKTLELMVVADWKMLEYYTSDVLPQYMLNVMNVVAGLFRDPSLEYSVDIVVTRSVIWEKDELEATRRDDQLSKFRSWVQRNNNYGDDTDPTHVDVGYLISKNGCVGGTSCGIEGLAYLFAMCTSSAVGVGRDRGLMGATTHAHEIGHILKARHDEELGCGGGSYIMSAGPTGGGEKSFQWSTCTSNTFKTFLLSSGSRCLDDVPSNKLTDSTYQLYGQVYDATQQCKFIWGSDYGECGPYKAHCDFLYCRYKQAMSCERLSFPSAHGTSCGTRKWCIQGHCIPDGTPEPQAVNGSWGAWGEYKECSRSCGVGIQWKERACNDPEPQHGGLWCDPRAKKRVNERGHHKTCNKQNCVNPDTGKEYAPGTMFGSTIADTDAQCYRYKKGYVTCKGCLSNENVLPCHLVCSRPKGNSGTLEGFVQDGTKCKTKKYKHDGVCVHGECREHGCDFEIESGIAEDRCGTCGGSGDFCKLVKDKDTKTHRQRGLHNVTYIPAGAIGVEVYESDKTYNFLGVSVEGKGMAIKLPSWSTHANLGDGVELEYVMKDYRYADQLKFHGKKLSKGVLVLCANYWSFASRGIEWKYLTPIDIAEAIGDTHWWTGDWEECSQSCGGDGQRRRDVYCHRSDGSDDTIVHPSKCPLSSNPQLRQVCNRVDCPSRWVIGAWSTCTELCGAEGERTRTIKCTVLSKEGDDKVVDDTECTTTKPDDRTKEKCNVKDCNPRWEIKSEFGACSVRCGGGKMTRKVECWRIKKDGSDKLEPDFACDKLVDPKPASEQSCNDDEPCPDWKVEYSDCSTSCGEGYEQVIVVCASEVQQFDVSWCDTGTKPSTAPRSCNNGPCTGQVWTTHPGLCSQSCGLGTTTLVVECIDVPTQTLASESDCDPDKKPATDTTQSCNPDICPLEHVWAMIYASCTVSCGGGTETGTAYCEHRVSGRRVVDSDCEVSTRPMDTTRTCNSQVCPNTDYKWVRKFETCSVTCGPGSESTVTTCVHVSDNTTSVSEENCTGHTKPVDETRACDLGECPPEATFHWHTVDLGCSADCGEDFHDYEIECREEVDDVISITNPTYCDEQTKPTAPETACPTLPACYKLNVHHGSCDVECGHGHKLREMTCIEVSTNETVDFAHCESLIDTADEAQPQYCNTTVNCDQVVPGYDFYAVGCYRDSSRSRTLPIHYAGYRSLIDWHNLTMTVVRCYNAAKRDRRPLVWFAVQFYGECWGGTDDQSSHTYNHFGESSRCYYAPPGVGVGRENTNYVYNMEFPVDLDEHEKLPPIISLGCYTNEIFVHDSATGDDSNTSVEEEETWERAKWDRFMQICVLAAIDHEFTTFGISNTGDCIDKTTALSYTTLDGFSRTCIPAMGAVEQFFVYEIYLGHEHH